MVGAAEAGTGRFGGVVDLVVGLSLDVDEARAAFLGSENAMIHQGQHPRHGGIEFRDRRAPRRNGSRRHASPGGRNQVAFTVNLVKDAPDDMEGGGEVGTSIRDEQTNARILDHVQGTFITQRAVASIEDNKARSLVQACFEIIIDEIRVFVISAIIIIVIRVRLIRGSTLGHQRLGLAGVDFALHDVELLVYGRKAVFWLDKDGAVHALSDVHTEWSDGAMIKEEAGMEKAERALGGFLEGRGENGGPAARTADAVQVDVVLHPGVILVGEIHFQNITDTSSKNGAGDSALKSPELKLLIANAQREHLPGGSYVDRYLGLMAPSDGRRHVGSKRETQRANYRKLVLWCQNQRLLSCVDRRGG